MIKLLKEKDQKIKARDEKIESLKKESTPPKLNEQLDENYFQKLSELE